MTGLDRQETIRLEQVEKYFGAFRVLKGISFTLRQGQIGCLLGPSACGKTTVLRAVAGFEDIHGGDILIRGTCMSRGGWSMPPEKRRVGLVFQDYCLFPHLTVAQNVAFGLRHLDSAKKRETVVEWLETVGLKGAGRAYPHQLSGGQQQRVALARALAPSPDILLLDEPFSNLDVTLRETLGQEVRRILKTSGVSALWVTHDQREAFTIADEIGVMGEGTLEQWGSSYDLYHKPANRFVADFIGQGVFLPGKVASANAIQTELGELPCASPLAFAAGTEVDVLLRPDDIVHDDHSSMKAEVVNKTFQGPFIVYTLKLASGNMLLAHVPSHHNHAVGEKVGIRPELDHVICFRR